MSNRQRIGLLILAINLVAGFGALTARQLGEGYVSVWALRRWADVLQLWTAHDVASTTLALTYPPLQNALLLLFYPVSGAVGPSLPYLFDTLAMAAVLTHFFWSARRACGDDRVAVGVLAAVMVHPFVLWAATSGAGDGMLVAEMYLLARALPALAQPRSVRGSTAVGSAMALMALSDPRFMFVVVAMIPCLPVLVNREAVQVSARSAYLLVFFPVVTVVGGYMYVNWLFMGSPFAFLTQTTSEFRGSFTAIEGTPWLRHYAGSFLGSGLIVLGMALLSFPVLALLIRACRARGDRMRSLAALTLVPVLGAALATATVFLAHPVQLLVLLIAPTLAGLVWALEAGVRKPALGALLLAGVLGGWGAFSWEAPDAQVRWTAAALGRPSSVAFAGELALGVWLRADSLTTLIDDHSAYPAIVASGSAARLVLPPAQDFKVSTTLHMLVADQIAIPDPSSSIGHADRLNQSFPLLYAKGQKGYTMVYDSGGWRVYRRVHDRRLLQVPSAG